MDSPDAILREVNTIAVVGCSRDPNKPAHAVPAQLQRFGFRIVPVNPYAGKLLGETTYRALREVPFSVDLVLVFRPSSEAPAVADQAVEIGAKALWLQQGLRSVEAERIARNAGLRYVEDECSGVVRSVHHIDKRKAS
ncbi:MAG TPA: CoA-binding protein [Polyangiales bacterium]|jgi:hypothetical protein|nr:CoA-binding protein [Polyangiales bacterium]